jgi:hypothetical protein
MKRRDQELLTGRDKLKGIPSAAGCSQYSCYTDVRSTTCNFHQYVWLFCMLLILLIVLERVVGITFLPPLPLQDLTGDVAYEPT